MHVVDRQAEGDEDDDLGEARERGVEALDVALVRQVGPSDDDPGDEDGDEARSVRDGGDPVDDAGRRERPQWVERRVREVDPAHRLDQQQRSGDADRDADGHLHDEFPDDDPERRVLVRCQLQETEHERDADRVVDA